MADLVFVMEQKQRNIIHKRFKELYQTKRIGCLYIPHDFDYMDPVLIELLKEGVAPYIDQT